jgi:hypothetical protein
MDEEGGDLCILFKGCVEGEVEMKGRVVDVIEEV